MRCAKLNEAPRDSASVRHDDELVVEARRPSYPLDLHIDHGELQSFPLPERRLVDAAGPQPLGAAALEEAQVEAW